MAEEWLEKYRHRFIEIGSPALSEASRDKTLTPEQYLRVRALWNETAQEREDAKPYSSRDLPLTSSNLTQRIESKKLLRVNIMRLAIGRLPDGSIDPNSAYAAQRDRLIGQIRSLDQQLVTLEQQFNEAPRILTEIDQDIARLEAQIVEGENAKDIERFLEMAAMLGVQQP